MFCFSLAAKPPGIKIRLEPDSKHSKMEIPPLIWLWHPYTAWPVDSQARLDTQRKLKPNQLFQGQCVTVTITWDTSHGPTVTQAGLLLICHTATDSQLMVAAMRWMSNIQNIHGFITAIVTAYLITIEIFTYCGSVVLSTDCPVIFHAALLQESS